MEIELCVVSTGEIKAEPQTRMVYSLTPQDMDKDWNYDLQNKVGNIEDNKNA